MTARTVILLVLLAGPAVFWVWLISDGLLSVHRRMSYQRRLRVRARQGGNARAAMDRFRVGPQRRLISDLLLAQAASGLSGWRFRFLDRRLSRRARRQGAAPLNQPRNRRQPHA